MPFMKQLFFLLFTVWMVSCSDQLECEIHNLQFHNLKGNVKEVYSVQFSVRELKDYATVFDDDFRNIPYEEALYAEYYHYDENGLCTNMVEYSIPYDKCKKNIYLVIGENGKTIEFVKWNVDNDKIDDKICHFEYLYNNDGQLIDTYDRLYDWVLSKSSKKISYDEMNKNLDDYIFVKSLGDTISALKFSKEKGLTDFIHYNVVDNKKYIFAYCVRCDVNKRCYLDEGKVVKNEYNDGMIETFDYSGNLLEKSCQQFKEGTRVFEYNNGYLEKGYEYDTGNNIVMTLDYSHSGNIRKNGNLKCVSTDQTGKQTIYEYYFENGKNVRQVVEDDSTVVTDYKYNESGDLVYVKNKDYTETRKYQYDEKGNWVICFITNTKGELSSVIQRVIIYNE